MTQERKGMALRAGGGCWDKSQGIVGMTGEKGRHRYCAQVLSPKSHKAARLGNWMTAQDS